MWRSRIRWLALLGCGWLVACGGGSEPLPAVRVQLVSGDQQTVTQHIGAGMALRVRVIDPQGTGISGADVSFAPAPDSGDFRPGIVATDAGGYAEFQTYFHAAGDEHVDATVPGYPPATFTVHVSPAGTPIDGYYTIHYSETHPSGQLYPDVFLFGVVNGALFDVYRAEGFPMIYIVSGAFDPATGTLGVTFRISLDIWRQFDGTLALDASAPGGANGAGTWVELFDGVVEPGTGGVWTADRS